MPAQDMLHVQFFPRDGNAIVSENCMAIAGEKIARVALALGKNKKLQASWVAVQQALTF